jgi:hypothetical protein
LIRVRAKTSSKNRGYIAAMRPPGNDTYVVPKNNIVISLLSCFASADQREIVFFFSELDQSEYGSRQPANGDSEKYPHTQMASRVDAVACQRQARASSLPLALCFSSQATSSGFRVSRRRFYDMTERQQRPHSIPFSFPLALRSRRSELRFRVAQLIFTSP